jgi:hypothetical protein
MREQYGPVMNEERPARIGNYDIIRPIDTGGMGEVYLARQRSAFGRLVAIKIIRSDLVYDATARARFLREAEVSAHLKHEHILPLFEFGEDQGRLFLITPYIEGGTLARRLKNGPLSPQEVHQLFVPLAQAVAYIHRRGVIHRDLKPTNILLDEQDGQVYVRLIDFGIASVQGSEASPPLTTAGHEIGTIAYMAPERLDGVAAPSNDIFSLGVILHQMLTGNLPMGDEIDDMPDPLRYVVHRCIALNPKERFATVEDVLRNFERAYQLAISSPRSNSARLSPLDNGTVSRIPAGESPAQEALQPQAVTLEDTRQLTSMPPEPVAQVIQAAPHTFGPGDYSAETVSFAQVQEQAVPPLPVKSARLTPLPPVEPAEAVEPPSQPVRPRRSRRSLLPLLSALTLIVLLAVVFLAYYAVQSVTVTAVTVNFSPKILALNEQYTITADPSAKSIDTTHAIIPEQGYSTTRQATGTGPATGQVNCILGVFCQNGVSQDDVTNLANQERPDLQKELAQAVEQKVASVGGTAITGTKYSDVSITSDPAVGQPADKVTVTLVEQGSVAYYINTDAQNVARQMLMRQVQQSGANYMLVSSTVEIGQPAIKSIDAATGKVTLTVAAGGDVVYQFPPSQLKAIQSALRGRTVKSAQAYLASQPGIDKSTIRIIFTQGSSTTLPGDIQYIHIVPINVSSYPPIQLQASPDATATASPAANQ